MTAVRRRPTVRLTVVLALAALAGLVATLLTSERRSGTARPSEVASTPPEVAPAGLEDLRSIEQPLSVWLRIADCESGEWGPDADPIPGTAEWTDGTRREGHSFEGGLHFEPGTWEDFRDPGMPDHAGEAPPVAQIVVAERVLEAQGWQAWPVCSRKAGVR